jgi:hypothetical protein
LSRTAAQCSARTLDTGLPYTHFPGVLVTPGFLPSALRASVALLRCSRSLPAIWSTTRQLLLRCPTSCVHAVVGHLSKYFCPAIRRVPVGMIRACGPHPFGAAAAAGQRRGAPLFRITPDDSANRAR